MSPSTIDPLHVGTIAILKSTPILRKHPFNFSSVFIP